MDEKVQSIAKNFSKRLASQLKQRGLNSTRSSTGINYTQFAHAIGCSKQMTRRYLLGEALPDYKTLLKIARWLNLSPGWLLFGEIAHAPSEAEKFEPINIDYELLEYILHQIAPLYQRTHNLNEIIEFTVSIIRDASCLDADRLMIKKIIDMMVSSAERFHHTNPQNRHVINHSTG